MPTPVLIVCSEGGSIDRHTNQLSIFDVIEKITFEVAESVEGESRVIPAGARPVTFNAFRMTAIWKQSGDDADCEFEFKTAVAIPGVPEAFVASQGKFVFKTILYRVIATVYTDMPPQSGEIVVRNSVRKSGTEEWVTQEYTIPVQRKDSSSANQSEFPLSVDI